MFNLVYLIVRFVQCFQFPLLSIRSLYYLRKAVSILETGVQGSDFVNSIILLTSLLQWKQVLLRCYIRSWCRVFLFWFFFTGSFPGDSLVIVEEFDEGMSGFSCGMMPPFHFSKVRDIFSRWNLHHIIYLLRFSDWGLHFMSWFSMCSL